MRLVRNLWVNNSNNRRHLWYLKYLKIQFYLSAKLTKNREKLILKLMMFIYIKVSFLLDFWSPFVREKNRSLFYLFLSLDLRPSQLISDLTLIRWIHEHLVFDKENLKQARTWKSIETWSNFITWSTATETQTTIQASTSEETMLVTKISKKLKNKSKFWKQDFLIRRKFRFLFQELLQFFPECLPLK
mgnify:CR=1 FL=1